MANIELNIVALGDFSSVNAQIKALQAQVAALNSSLGVGSLSPQLSSSLKTATNDFSNALTASNAFTKQTVQLTSETTKFGQALEGGKLSLAQYYQIVTGKSGAATQSVKQLALEQTKLQNSVIMADPTKQGFYSVFTPTTIDAAANATKIAANEANIYAMAVNKGSQSLINFGKNTQWAGRQLTVGMSVPMIAFGSQAVKSFNEVNTALTQLQKVYGEGLTPPSQNDINKISQDVLNLGRQLAATTGISQTFTVQVASQFAAMGKMGDQLTQATEQTVRLAKLGNLDQQTATSAIIALQNVYKLNTTQLSDAVNYFGAIQKQTSLSMTDLVSAESRVGPIIDQLGGSYKDTSVMLLAMKEAGVPAAQAANALKSAFGSIIAPTAAANKEFSSFGINLSSIKNAGGPVQMIEALQASLQNLSPLVREQLIEKLFGKYQFARISALIDNFGKVGSQTANAIKVAGATSSQLQDLANQEMKQATSSPSAQWQIALNTFKADLYPVGQMIMKIGTDVLKFANGVSKAFGSLPGPVKLILGVLLGFVAISGPIIMLTGLLANFAGNILKGVFNLKQLVTGGKTLGQLLTPELVAAQNASDLFSKGVLGDADAIKLLNEQIVILTDNLNNLVNKMGAGAGLPELTSSLKTDVGTLLTRQVAVAEQMALPGFADGGIIRGPGTGTSDSILARVSNGETILTEEQTKKYHPVVQAILKDNLPGYADGKKDTFSIYGENTIYPEEKSTNRGQTTKIVPNENQLAASLAARLGESRGIPINPSNVGAGKFDPIVEEVSPFVQNFKKELDKELGGIAETTPAKFAEAWKKAGTKAMQDLSTPSPETRSVYGKFAGTEEQSYNTFARDPQGGARKPLLVGEKTKSYTGTVGQGIKSLYTRTSGDTTPMDIGHVFPPKQLGIGEVLNMENVGNYPMSAATDPKYYNLPPAEIAKIRESAKQTINQIESEMKKAAEIQSPSAKFNREVGQPIVEGIQQGFQETLPGFENMVTTSVSGVTDTLAADTKPWWMTGEKYANSIGQGITENSSAIVDAANKVADEATTSIGSRVKGALSGTMGKTGGIGLAMMLPMLTGMLPKTIGGTNISGLTNIGTTATTAGMTASMIGMGAETGTMAATIGSLAMPIAGVVAGLGLLKLGIDSINNANREAANVIQETYGKNSITTSYFGLSSSNISQFDFSGLIAGVKESTSSIQENKAAVDALTAAYQNATDQMTKDYINKVKSADYGQLQDLMKSRYATDLAQGMTSKQSLQDVTAILKAGGRDSLTRQGVLSSIGAKSTDNATTGFTNALKNALAPYESKASAVAKGGPAATLVPKGGPAPKTQVEQLKQGAITDIATELLNVAQTTPKNLKTIVDGFKSAGGSAAETLVNSNGVFKALRDTVEKSNPDLAKWMEKMNKAGLSTVDMAKAISLLNSGVVQTPEALGKATDSAKTWAANIEKLFNDAKTQSTATGGGSSTGQNPPSSTTTPTVFTGTAEEKSLQKLFEGNLAAQNAQLKIARDQLTVQNKISQEAKAQLQYQQQITGLQNDMKTAMISGNYLQAAAYKQQISSAKVDFNATSVSTRMQNQIDALQGNADQINQALSDLKDLIGQEGKIIPASILAAKNIKPINAATIVGDVAGGTPTVTTVINVTGTVNSTSTVTTNPKGKQIPTKTKVVTQGQKIKVGNQQMTSLQGIV